MVISDHFIMHKNTASLYYIPETNVIVYVNYNSEKICMTYCIMEILAIINQNAISDKNSRKLLKSILNTRIVYSLVE